MKNLPAVLKSFTVFVSVAIIAVCCNKKDDITPPVIVTCNSNLHSGYTLIANDTCNDGIASDKLDGTVFEYKYDAASDSLWFLIAVNSISATQSIGVSVVVNFEDGSPSFNYWGNSNTAAWNKMVNVWVTGTAPSAYTGTIGVADATGVNANNYNNLKQNNVSIKVDTAAKTILLGLKRTDLVTDAQFGASNSITFKAAAGVGANDGWNDDIYSATGSITVTKSIPGVVLPTLTTTSASLITLTSASSGGNVISDGGSSVTLRGVAYATHTTPTTADQTVTSGVGTGSFTTAISGLTRGTQYYARAFAINSAGTAYGNEVTFTTLALLPTLTTTAASAITNSTATSGGNVTDDGGAAVTERGIAISTSPNPTTAGFTILSGTGTGSFVTNITGMSGNTVCYVRAYATNSAGTAYGNQITFTTANNCGTVTDLSGNTYNTVAIGQQCWTKENLRAFVYNDGTSIPYVTNNTAWANLTTPGQGNYNNDNVNTPIYGVLYNWYVVNTTKVCPAGWHVPTETEWADLVAYVGGGSGPLKSTSSLWTSPNVGATNNSGFSALPAGEHLADGSFQNLGFATFFWTSTPLSSSTARAVSMFANDANAYQAGPDKRHGASIRCVKD